jgi:transcriptional regulator with XRE-family HTH domain
MGRVNSATGKVGKTSWATFGWWIEARRSLTQYDQAQAAEAIGVTRRQWIRYTQGAPVPRKRIPAIAKMLGAPLKQVLAYAGYDAGEEATPEVDVYLRRIRERVFEGTWSGALLTLYQLFYEVQKEKKKHKSRSDQSMAINFVVAAVAMNQMPAWLRREFIEYLLAVEIGGVKHDFPQPPEIQKKVRDKVNKILSEAILREDQFPLLQFGGKWDFEDVFSGAWEFGESSSTVQSNETEVQELFDELTT